MMVLAGMMGQRRLTPTDRYGLATHWSLPPVFYVLRTAMTYINNPERYIKIMDWAARRYTKNGVLNLSERGYCPSPYLRIEDAALRRYIVPRVASDGIRKPI